MDRRQHAKIRADLNLQRKPLALPLHLGQNLLLGAAALSCLNSPVHYLAIPLLAILFFRGFGMMHDAVHLATSRHRLINYTVGVWSGIFCFLPFEPWRRSHLEHHYWSGNIEKDPVTQLINTYPKMSELKRNTLSSIWMAWLPVLSVLQYAVFWRLSLATCRRQPTMGLWLSLLTPPVFWGATLAIAPLSFILGILVPAVLVYLFVVEVVNFPHHLQLPQFHGETKFAIWDQHISARTCIYPRWFARFVTLNFNYHVEHHMYPDVPWYHLDKLQERISRELGIGYNCDTHLEWILENKKKTLGQVLAATPAEIITRKPA